MKSAGIRLHFARRFLITYSISLLVFGLFRLPISSWFGLDRVYIFRYSFLLRYSIYSHIIVNSRFLWSSILLLSVVMSPLSFRTLSLFSFSPSSRRLASFIYSKNQLLVSLIFPFSCQVSMSFISTPILVFPFLLSTLSLASSFSSSLTCQVRSFIWDLLLARRASVRLQTINSCLRTNFTASLSVHVRRPFSFVSSFFFISLSLSSLTRWLFRSMLINLHIF